MPGRILAIMSGIEFTLNFVLVRSLLWYHLSTMQIAKEHGIALGKKDVATLKKFFQSDQRPSMQCDTPDHSQLRISKSSEK